MVNQAPWRKTGLSPGLVAALGAELGTVGELATAVGAELRAGVQGCAALRAELAGSDDLTALGAGDPPAGGGEAGNSQNRASPLEVLV